MPVLQRLEIILKNLLINESNILLHLHIYFTPFPASYECKYRMVEHEHERRNLLGTILGDLCGEVLEKAKEY